LKGRVARDRTYLRVPAQVTFEVTVKNGAEVQRKFPRINGEFLSRIQQSDGLRFEYVLQRFRDVWRPIDTYPFLALDAARVNAHWWVNQEFAVFPSGRMMQNMRPSEGADRLLNRVMGGGIDAGMSPDTKLLVEGMANPQSNWMMPFNNSLAIGMHPFAALGTVYIYIDSAGRYQRKFAELVVVDKHSRPLSVHIDFDPLADMVRTYSEEYLNPPPDTPRNLDRLSALLDAMFFENEKIIAAATQHHRERAPFEKPFDYIAPTLTRYGRLVHDAAGQPRIELSFALMHYEKALHEFHEVKEAVKGHDTEAAFFHGVYCIVAIAACAEAIANRLVFQQTKAHPDRFDKRKPAQKINVAAEEIAKHHGRTFIPLTAGMPLYDALEKVRELRNIFMHAKEKGEEVDPSTQTSTLFSGVDESRCRDYLRNLRLAVAHVYDQLAPECSPPIVTRENVEWLQGLEVP
jgi:hypothetical protein